VPDNQPMDTPEHGRYEMLCALAAGGLLEGLELAEFQSFLGGRNETTPTACP
jgi:hypothetical protein